VLRRALSFVMAAAVVVGIILSPVADWAVTAVASDPPSVRGIRHLNYDLAGHRELPREMYERVLAGTPLSVASLYVMGSSEFGVPTDQNPSRLLPATVTDFDMYLSGRGHQQSLYHALELAAVAPALRTRKVALIVSPQWFANRDGIAEGAFRSVFSYSAWDEMLANASLSPSVRQRLVSRVGELMPELCSARALCSTNPAWLAKAVIDIPYDAVDVRLGFLKESYDSKKVRSRFAYTGPYVQQGSPMATFDWTAARAQADQQAAAAIKKPYGIQQDYYDRRILPYLASLKGHEANVQYTESREYDDLDLFLEVAHDLDLQVMLVAQPVNGLWSDYTGLPMAERTVYAQKVRQVADNKWRVDSVHLPLTFVDMTDRMYDPHYFFDTLHLGWRGWLDVTEICWRFAHS